VEPPPAETPVPTVEAPEPAKPKSKNPHWNPENVAKGLCARCGEPRGHYAQHCNECQAKWHARSNRRQGLNPWRPGSRGRTPRWAVGILHLATTMRDVILETDEARNSPDVARAGVVMIVGFFFRQQLDWIVPFTGYPERECKVIVGRLKTHGIWLKDGMIACRWMELLASAKRIPKREHWTYELSFWLDAMVANGDLFREPKGDDFAYGLIEWQRK
jgi:hypothetical protein